MGFSPRVRRLSKLAGAVDGLDADNNDDAVGLAYDLILGLHFPVVSIRDRSLEALPSLQPFGKTYSRGSFVAFGLSRAFFNRARQKFILFFQ